MDIKDSMHPPGLIFLEIMGIGIIIETGIISGKTQDGIIINIGDSLIQDGIIMEVASSKNGREMVALQSGIADTLFSNLKPVAIAAGIFLFLYLDK
jgi:hypothetical protein